MSYEKLSKVELHKGHVLEIIEPLIADRQWHQDWRSTFLGCGNRREYRFFKPAEINSPQIQESHKMKSMFGKDTIDFDRVLTISLDDLGVEGQKTYGIHTSFRIENHNDLHITQILGVTSLNNEAMALPYYGIEEFSPEQQWEFLDELVTKWFTPYEEVTPDQAPVPKIA